MIFNIKNMIITQCTYKIYSYRVMTDETEICTNIMKNIRKLCKSNPTVLNREQILRIYNEMTENKDSWLFKNYIGAILEYVTKNINNFTIFVLILTQVVENNRSPTFLNITRNDFDIKILHRLRGIKYIRPFRNQLKKKEDILYNLGIFFTEFDSLLGDENINQAIRILSDVRTFDATNGDVVRDKFLDLYTFPKDKYKKYIDKIDTNKIYQAEKLIIQIYFTMLSIKRTISSADEQKNYNDSDTSQKSDYDINNYCKLYNGIHRVVTHYLCLYSNRHSSKYFFPEVVASCNIYHNITTLATTATFLYVIRRCLKMVQKDIVTLGEMLENIEKHMLHQIKISDEHENDKKKAKFNIKGAFDNNNAISKRYKAIHKSIVSYNAQYDNWSALTQKTEHIKPNEAIKQSFEYKKLAVLGGASAVLVSLNRMSQQGNNNNDPAAPMEERGVDSPNTNSDASSDSESSSEEALPSNPSEPVISNSSSNS